MIQAQFQTTADGAIVFDARALAQAAGANPDGREHGGFDPDWFDAGHWRALGRAEDAHGGRGGAIYFDAPFGRCALRHYRRGGMIANLMGDRYLWTGAERTRGFAEFRLLADLNDRGMRVPAPLAARYRRDGVHYRADLITRRIENAVSLADLVVQDRCDARVATCVGAVIAEIHAAGACHADLNAHNVLLVGGQAWVLDFDRGQLRTPARAWQLANLMRLRRSLIKLGAARDGEADFERTFWYPLMAAYENHFAELRDGQVRSTRT
jgi:3-deoxy-D-manno-octulosonic acid kinase